MPFQTRISAAVATAMVDAARIVPDSGPGPGYVEIRDGTQPATVATAATGTLLATLVCSDPAFGAAVNGVATAAAVADDLVADATGTATWFRVFNSAGVACWDGSCGTSGSDMIFNSTSLVAGGLVELLSWTITQPLG
jgi:hypothetical protein